MTVSEYVAKFESLARLALIGRSSKIGMKSSRSICNLCSPLTRGSICKEFRLATELGVRGGA
ncbi:hypothetical protein CR513_33215, partial [Mucuna pruriens]